MAEHLVFTLCAAMAAMGDLAGHERRGTLTWPGRSAILGLVAAAMGIRREDAAGLARLEGLRLAVGVIDDGVALRDYHTVETVPSAVARNPDSRPAAIARAGRATNTTITLRDYRVGVAYAVALWPGPDWTGGLQDLARALHQPVFALYLGRKSCPLAMPPAPYIVDAESPLQALAQDSRPPFGHQGGLRLIASEEALTAHDRIEFRHDRAIDRGKWHFAPRRVHLHHPVPGGTA